MKNSPIVDRLRDLSDVTFGSPGDGHELVYDVASGKFVFRAPAVTPTLDAVLTAGSTSSQTATVGTIATPTGPTGGLLAGVSRLYEATANYFAIADSHLTLFNDRFFVTRSNSLYYSYATSTLGPSGPSGQAGLMLASGVGPTGSVVLYRSAANQLTIGDDTTGTSTIIANTSGFADAVIGRWAYDANYAYVGASSFNTVSGYALVQHASTGATNINGVGNLFLNVTGVTQLTMNGSTAAFAPPVTSPYSFTAPAFICPGGSDGLLTMLDSPTGASLTIRAPAHVLDGAGGTGGTLKLIGGKSEYQAHGGNGGDVWVIGGLGIANNGNGGSLYLTGGLSGNPANSYDGNVFLDGGDAGSGAYVGYGAPGHVYVGWNSGSKLVIKNSIKMYTSAASIDMTGGAITNGVFSGDGSGLTGLPFVAPSSSGAPGGLVTGGIYYDAGDGHFYGLSGGLGLVRLDN